MILVTVLLASNAAVAAAQQHARFGDRALRATRLAENLIEEIIGAARPVPGSAGRAAWRLHDYNALVEQPGHLRDFTGDLCPPRDQVFRRSVVIGAVTADDALSPALAYASVIVTIEHPGGDTWQVTRRIPIPE